MNVIEARQKKRTGCCFITRGFATNGVGCGKSPNLCMSLRKMTVAVALSMTLSWNGASIAEGMMSTGSMVRTGQEQEMGLNVRHKPRGASIANRLRKHGIPDCVSVMAVSALPVVELRGGIPLGHYLGMGRLQTLMLAIIGNLAPMIPTLLLLRIRLIRSAASMFLERAKKVADSVSNERSRVAGLALFVGVPLPGTGAWTGCLVAFLLGMPMGAAFGALSVGVVMAGIIVSALCELGWVGAIVAGCLLLGGGAMSVWHTSRGKIEGEENG